MYVCMCPSHFTECTRTNDTALTSVTRLAKLKQISILHIKEAASALINIVLLKLDVDYQISIYCKILDVVGVDISCTKLI